MGYVGFFFFNGKPFPCIWGINRPAHLHDMLGRQSNSLPSQGSDKAGLCSSLQFQPCTVEKKKLSEVLLSVFSKFSSSKSSFRLPSNYLHCIFGGVPCALPYSAASAHRSPVSHQCHLQRPLGSHWLRVILRNPDSVPQVLCDLRKAELRFHRPRATDTQQRSLAPLSSAVFRALCHMKGG